jgi:hypothetical protein
MVNIQRRGTECETLCACCNRLNGDGAHLFLKCKEIKQLWRNIGMEDLRQCMSIFEDVKEVVQEILALDDEKKILIFCLLSVGGCRGIRRARKVRRCRLM